MSKSHGLRYTQTYSSKLESFLVNLKKIHAFKKVHENFYSNSNISRTDMVLKNSLHINKLGSTFSR